MDVQNKTSYTLLSETRRLLQYYMFSLEDEALIEVLFAKLSNGSLAGVSVFDLLQFFDFDSNTFYQNLFYVLSGHTGIVSYHSFTKFVIMISFMSTISVMSNCYNFYCSQASNVRTGTELFLNLFIPSEISEDRKSELKSRIISYHSDFSDFLVENRDNQSIVIIFQKFYDLKAEVSKRILGFDRIKLTVQKLDNYYHLYNYYSKHNKSPSPSICHYFKIKLCNKINPYKFEYILPPEKVKNFEFPFILSQGFKYNRCGSSIQTMNLSPPKTDEHQNQSYNQIKGNSFLLNNVNETHNSQICAENSNINPNNGNNNVILSPNTNNSQIDSIFLSNNNKDIDKKSTTAPANNIIIGNNNTTNNNAFNIHGNSVIISNNNPNTNNTNKIYYSSFGSEKHLLYSRRPSKINCRKRSNFSLLNAMPNVHSEYVI